MIALTRHDVANATLMGFQALGAEVATIRIFTINNRIALDVITAAEGGVCAIVGDDSCSTYLPSESESLGNLSTLIFRINVPVRLFFFTRKIHPVHSYFGRYVYFLGGKSRHNFRKFHDFFSEF